MKKIPRLIPYADLLDMTPEALQHYEYQNFQSEYGLSREEYINNYIDLRLLDKTWDDMKEETKREYLLNEIVRLESQLNYWRNYL